MDCTYFKSLWLKALRSSTDNDRTTAPSKGAYFICSWLGFVAGVGLIHRRSIVTISSVRSSRVVVCGSYVFFQLSHWTFSIPFTSVLRSARSFALQRRTKWVRWTLLTKNVVVIFWFHKRDLQRSSEGNDNDSTCQVELLKDRIKAWCGNLEGNTDAINVHTTRYTCMHVCVSVLQTRQTFGGEIPAGVLLSMWLMTFWWVRLFRYFELSFALSWFSPTWMRPWMKSLREKYEYAT